MKNIKLIFHGYRDVHEYHNVLLLKDQLAKALDVVIQNEQDFKMWYDDNLGKFDGQFNHLNEVDRQWALECKQFKYYTKTGDLLLKAIKTKLYPHLVQLAQATKMQISYYDDEQVLKWVHKKDDQDQIVICLKLWSNQLANLDQDQIATISDFINDCNRLLINPDDHRLINWNQFKVGIKDQIFQDWKMINKVLGIVFQFVPKTNAYQATLQYDYKFDHILVDEKQGEFNFQIANQCDDLKDLVKLKSPLGQFLNDPNLLANLKPKSNQAHQQLKSKQL